MPVALVAALLASLGLHAAALFIPETEPAPLPEAPAALHAEIILQPRAAPVAEKLPARPVARKPRPRPAGSAAAVAPAVPIADSATMAAVAGSDGDAGESGAPTAAPAAPTPEAEPAIAPAAVPAAESPALPAAGTIAYQVYRGDPPTLIGRAEHRWQIADGRYRIVSVMETTGVAAWVRAVRIDTESSGALSASGLVPARYVSRRHDRERIEQVDFDHEAGLARFGNGTTAPLPAGAQDLLSFNYQLGWLARTGDMTIATGRKLGTYRLELLGKEWVETAVQPVWALRFRASGETTTEVWLAADNHLLPVKIRHIDKRGERFEQIAHDIRPGISEPDAGQRLTE